LYGSDDGFGLSQRSVVPEPQHAKPLGFQPCRAFCIVRLMLRVLPAVQLYDHPMRKRDEVHDVGANWLLAPELDAIQSMAPQATPKAPFGVGLVHAKTSCAACR
jgi:hypothetical protein